MSNLKHQFASYIKISEKKAKRLWRECIFVPDTNVLLNLYRYSQGTRDEFIEIITRLQEQEQIFLPHHVAHEFMSNRPSTILKQVHKYNDLVVALDDILNQIQDDLKKLNIRNHPFIDIEKIRLVIKDKISEIKDQLENEKSEHPDLLSDEDQILNTLSDLLSNKIGKAYDKEELEDIYKDADERYKSKIPPGYCDAGYCKGKEKKEGDKKYGDYVIWKQLLDISRKEDKPIIFITNDSSEDWWWDVHGQTQGPKPELIEEFQLETGQEFYMYKPNRFMSFAIEYLDFDIEQDAIDEVKDVGKSDLHEVSYKFLIDDLSSSNYELIDVMMLVETERKWNKFLKNISRKRPELAKIIAKGYPTDVQNRIIEISFPHLDDFKFASKSGKWRIALEKELSDFFGTEIEVVFSFDERNQIG